MWQNKFIVCFDWPKFSSVLSNWYLCYSYVYSIMCTYICICNTLFDILDPRNARTDISHIALLASLNNLVIGNGGSYVVHFMYTFMESVHFMYILHFSLLHASFLHKLWCLDYREVAMVFKVCKSSLSCFSIPCS